MTGYGRGELSRDGVKIVVELRSVNRRQAELHLKLPNELECLEARSRDGVNAAFARGRCDLIASLERPDAPVQARINRAAARAYAAEFEALARELGADPAVVEATWRAMIAAFIASELQTHAQRAAATAPPPAP